MVIFSMANIVERRNNLEDIINILLPQCDIFHLNLINYDEKINLDIKSKKIIYHYYSDAGSEIRLIHYSKYTNGYYFTIDDDILYPKNYVDVMLSNMNINPIVCVHGSIINLNKTEKYYENRKVYHFSRHLNKTTKVMFPGVGTSAFDISKIKINHIDFKIKNMSDIYIGVFSAQQNITPISINRSKNWLTPLPEYNVRIFGNNPHEEIDKIINKNKKLWL